MSRMTFCPKCRRTVEIDEYGFIFCKQCNKYFSIKKRQGSKKKNEKCQRSFVADYQEVVDNGG